MMLFRAAVCTLLLTTLSAAAAAQGQDQGTLLLGPVTLKPTITLSDAGYDSNIFNVPDAFGPQQDVTAVFSPATTGRLHVGLVRVDFTGAVDMQYFRTLTDERAVNRGGTVRIEPQFTRFRPFAAGSYRRTRNRESSEIDLRVPRIESGYSGGVALQVLTRGVVELSAGRGQLRYGDAIFRGVSIAERLDRDNTRGGVRFQYELSPLTSFFVDTGLQQDRFVATPELDSDSVHTSLGFSFAPDAVIRGRAQVGYRHLTPKGRAAVEFDGPTAAVDLAYTLLGRTTFSGRLVRDTTYSTEQQPYYVSNLASLEVAQNIAGPVDVLVRGTREDLDYDALPQVQAVAHLEKVNILGGGVAVHLSPRALVTVNYDRVTRRSDILTDRDYNRRRLYTTITYGF